jgi:cellulose biosynthesis protein BcsQ
MDFLTGTGENTQVYQVNECIDILPSHLNNMLLNNIMDQQLKINIQESGLLERYDYILIDPPDYRDAHTRNAVFAADVLLIPETCSRIDFEATKLYALVCLCRQTKHTP